MTDIAEYGFPLTVAVDWAGDGRYQHTLSDVSQRWTRIQIGYGASRTANPRRPIIASGQGTVVLYGAEFIPGVSEVFSESRLRERHQCRISLTIGGVTEVVAQGWLLLAKRAGFRSASFTWEGLLEQAGRRDVKVMEPETNVSLQTVLVARHITRGYGLATMRNFIDPLQLGPVTYRGPLARFVSEYCRVGGAYPCATASGGLNIARSTSHLAGYPTIDTQTATVLAVRPTLDVEQIFNVGILSFPPAAGEGEEDPMRQVEAGLTTDAATVAAPATAAMTIVKTFTLPALPAGQQYEDFGVLLESVRARVVARAPTEGGGSGTHGDTHGDIHGDTHADHQDHVDTHADQAGTHVDTHADTHADHQDGVHVDTHSDHTDGAHADHTARRAHADRPHVNRARVNVSHFDGIATHADLPHANLAHVNVPAVSSHADQRAGGHADTHGDHTDGPTLHADTHGDHADTHVDAHLDVAHVNRVHVDIPHGDSPHVDSHGDRAHVNVPALDRHTDHTDRGRPHVDQHADRSHTDIPHVNSAHVDTHADHQDDVPHSDVHIDRDHANSAHVNRAHVNRAHVNTSHFDGIATHADTAHIDRAHANTAHANAAHFDIHGDHTDTTHQDAHGDSHSDSAHVNVPAVSSHADHTDSATPHADTHADRSHANAAHVNRAHVNTAHVNTARHVNAAHVNRARIDYHVDHQDHVDTHADTPAGHVDTHGDHTDGITLHADTHADHADTHVDTHADTHADHQDGVHADTHDDHTDHVDTHSDAHSDHTPGVHADTHVDRAAQLFAYGETAQSQGFTDPAVNVAVQKQMDGSVDVTVTVVFAAATWPGTWIWTQIAADGTPVNRSGTAWGTSGDYVMGVITAAGLAKIWGLTAHVLVQWNLTGSDRDRAHGDGQVSAYLHGLVHLDTARVNATATHTDAHADALTPPHADHTDTAHQDRAHGDQFFLGLPHVNVSHVNQVYPHADQAYPVAPELAVENLGSITEWGRRELRYPPWFHRSAVAGLQARINELSIARYTWAVDFALIQPTDALTRIVARLEPGTYVRLRNQGSSVGPDVDAICLVVHAELALGQGTPMKRMIMLDTGDVP